MVLRVHNPFRILALAGLLALLACGSAPQLQPEPLVGIVELRSAGAAATIAAGSDRPWQPKGLRIWC